MDIAHIAFGMSEHQMVMPAHQQGSGRQQGQDIAIGDHAGMAEHDADRAHGEKIDDIGLGPFDRGGEDQVLAAGFRIGIERVGGDADHHHLCAADLQHGVAGGVFGAGAGIEDVRDHRNPKRIGLADELGKVIVEIGLMIADIDDHRGQRCQLFKKLPIGPTGRAGCSDVAELENVTVDQDQIGAACDLGGDGRQHLRQPVIG